MGIRKHDATIIRCWEIGNQSAHSPGRQVVEGCTGRLQFQPTASQVHFDGQPFIGSPPGYLDCISGGEDSSLDDGKKLNF